MPEGNNGNTSQKEVKPNNRDFQYKSSVIHLESIFDVNEVAANRTEVNTNLDALLNIFGKNEAVNEQSRGVIDYFNKNSVGNVRLAYVVGEKMHPYRLGSEVPSVQDIIDVGNNIMVRGDDGQPVTFTEKYFLNNDMVKTLMDEEVTNEARGLGSAMATFLYTYLAESNNKDLKNYDQIFNNVKINEVPAFYKDAGGTIHAIVDKDSHLEYEKEIDKLIGHDKEASEAYKSNKEEIEKLSENKKSVQEEAESAKAKLQAAFDDFDKSKQAFDEKYHEAPEQPVKPVEKSRWRRFFHGIGLAPHSKKYIARKNAYDAKLVEYNNYLTEKAKIDDKLNALGEAANKVEKAVSALDDLESNLQKLDEKMNAAKNSIGIYENEELNAFENNKKADYAGKAANATAFVTDFFIKKENERARECVKVALKDKSGLGKIDKSSVFAFEEGGLHMMMSMINDKKSSRSILHAQLLKRTAYDLYEKCEKMVKNAKITDEGKKNTALRLYLDREYKLQANNARKLFESTFNMKATPANVQAVIDELGLEQQVYNRIDKVDKEKLNDINKVPKVNARNVDDMTLLVVAGLKTAIREGGLTAKTGEMEYNFKSYKVEPVKETSIVKLNKKINGQEKDASKPKHSDAVKESSQEEKVSENSIQL